VDGWLQIKVPASTAVLIKRLREAVDLVLMRSVSTSSVTVSQQQQQQGSLKGNASHHAATAGSSPSCGTGLVSQQALAVMAVVQQLLAAEAAAELGK
jgi:hypothetical protein